MPCNTPQKSKGWMERAGFVDVEEHILKLPVGTWPKKKKFKFVGLFEMVNKQKGLEALSMMAFTRALKWSPERMQVFLAEVRKQMKIEVFIVTTIGKSSMQGPCRLTLTREAILFSGENRKILPGSSCFSSCFFGLVVIRKYSAGIITRLRKNVRSDLE
jgi:hypothetical protein